MPIWSLLLLLVRPTRASLTTDWLFSEAPSSTAVCHFTSPGYGNLILRGNDEAVTVRGVISGLKEGYHGLHVHQVGTTL